MILNKLVDIEGFRMTDEEFEALIRLIIDTGDTIEMEVIGLDTMDIEFSLN